MSAVLTVEDLSVSHAGLPTIAVESLALLPGTLTGIVGANGAGKSTLVNAIAGWSRGSPAVRGRIILDGADISAMPAHERARSGITLVPEGHGVFLRLSVEDNLRAVVASGAAGRRSFGVEDVFALFPRLQERRANLAASLSGGERQMLALGRALRMAPRVLLLDEPSIGLAPRLVLALLQAVRRLVDDGLTVLLVEQNVRAAVEVVDSLTLLERGRVVASGPVAAMRDDPRIIDAYLGTSHG